MKRKLLIDCHTGTCDLPALILAGRVKDLDICGLTACYDPDKPSADRKDLLALRNLARLEADCALGARRPMIPRRPCNGGPGAAGEHSVRPEGGYAWELIYEQALQSHEGLTVLLLGPATNLAIALLRYPELREHIHQVILAGGSFGFGDAAPYAERNVWEDAYACKVLLRSGVPVTMIGLSASADAGLSELELKTALHPLVGEALPQCMEDLSIRRLGDAYVLPSLVAAAWMLDPEVVEMDRFHVEVEVDGTEMYGRTVIEWRHYLHEPEETQVAVSADREKLLACLARAGKEG